MKNIFIIFSIILLIYMLWPGPAGISDFTPLPASLKSRLEGDTIQIPDVAGYFSDNFRQFATGFYKSDYQQRSSFPFGPVTLNHPPEYSWTAIKKHTDSTYLEEFVYPLRDSLYVNGFEPFYQGGKPKFWGSSKFYVSDRDWFTKTTLRFYPSHPAVRIAVWFGITVSIYWLFKLGKRII